MTIYMYNYTCVFRYITDLHLFSKYCSPLLLFLLQCFKLCLAGMSVAA